MFVIEKLIADHQAKVERWESARDKWIKSAAEYDYRSESDYRSKHPHPSSIYKTVARYLIIVIVIAILAFVLLGFIREIREDKNKPKEAPATVQNEKNCQGFNKGDKVRIQYGDHSGNVGTIIGGCELGNHYQVKLDEGSKANVPDNDPDPADVGGWTISVNDRDNLVVIEDKKE